MRSHDNFLILLDANLETRFSRRETLSPKISRIESRVSRIETWVTVNLLLSGTGRQRNKTEGQRNENVTWKIISRQLYRHFSINLPNVAVFSWNWITTTTSKFRKRKKNSTSCASAIIPRIKRFHVVVVLGWQRNEPNSVMRLQNYRYAY